MTVGAQFYDLNQKLCAFTRIFPESIPTEEGAQGALSGYSFGVKDLLDIAGHVTTAGSVVLTGEPAATKDAIVVSRLRAAGAQLVGTTNMDEFAYGFVTENAHYGITRNPHDVNRLAGGSSGGSAAAVAAGLADFALGSDTNGSIRIPASICGIFGLRPTHGVVPEDGCFPFVERLDVVGPFARNPDLLRDVFAVMSGTQVSPVKVDGLRVGILTGWFQDGADADVLEGVRAIGEVLGGGKSIELPLAAAARSAAFILTAAEGGKRHLTNLQQRPMDFDPATRDRLIAGALMPAEFVDDAECVATQFIEAAAALFDDYDVLLAPSTPCVAPKIGEPTIIVNGKPLPARANLGLYAQPISLTGAPALSMPLKRPGKLPIGVQAVAAKGREELLFSIASLLTDSGIVGCDEPAFFMQAVA